MSKVHVDRLRPDASCQARKSWPADGNTLTPLLQSSSETFFRKFQFWDGGGQDAPPVFEVDGIHYLHVKVKARAVCFL